LAKSAVVTEMWHSCHFQLTCSTPHHKLLPSPHRCQQHSQRNFRQHIPTLLPKTRPSLLLSPRHCQPYFHFTTQPPLLPMLKLPLQRACFLHCQRKCRLRRHHFKQGNITLVTLMIFPLPQSPHLIIQPFYDVIPNATHDSSASPPTNPCLLKLQRDRLRTKTYLCWAQTSNPRTHPRTHLQAFHGNESTKVEVATTVAVVVVGRLMQHSSFSYARTAKHKREQRMPQMFSIGAAASRHHHHHVSTAVIFVAVGIIFAIVAAICAANIVDRRWRRQSVLVFSRTCHADTSSAVARVNSVIDARILTLH